MNSYLLFGIVAVYLGILFFAAYWGENKAPRKWVSNPYIYTLSIAVYCSAWTYYGSIGNAATSGISFLPIYLGPMIVAPLWIIILRKVIRISKQHKISSVADFISLRYGSNDHSYIVEVQDNSLKVDVGPDRYQVTLRKSELAIEKSARKMFEDMCQ